MNKRHLTYKYYTVFQWHTLENQSLLYSSLMWVRYCKKSIYIFLINYVSAVFPFYKWNNWELRKMDNFSRITLSLEVHAWPKLFRNHTIEGDLNERIALFWSQDLADVTAGPVPLLFHAWKKIKTSHRAGDQFFWSMVTSILENVLISSDIMTHKPLPWNQPQLFFSVKLCSFFLLIFSLHGMGNYYAKQFETVFFFFLVHKKESCLSAYR